MPSVRMLWEEVTAAMIRFGPKPIEAAGNFEGAISHAEPETRSVAVAGVHGPPTNALRGFLVDYLACSS